MEAARLKDPSAAPSGNPSAITFLSMGTFDDIRFLRDYKQTQTVKLPAGTGTFFIWTLSGRASLQRGEGQLLAQGSTAKMRTKPEGLGILTVRFSSHGAILGLACQLRGRKPKAIAKDASGARLISFQQGRSRPRPTATRS